MLPVWGTEVSVTTTLQFSFSLGSILLLLHFTDVNSEWTPHQTSCTHLFVRVCFLGTLQLRCLQMKDSNIHTYIYTHIHRTYIHLFIYMYIYSPVAYLVVQRVKKLPVNAGDPGSIPGSGRSPRKGNGNPLQCSCLENPMDRGAWQAIVHGVTKIPTWLSMTGVGIGEFLHQFINLLSLN